MRPILPFVVAVAACFFTAPAALAAPDDAGVAAPARAAGLEVLSLASGTGVQSRRLVGETARFDTDADRVWVHAVVRNLGAPTQVTLVWSLEGVEHWRVTLDVGTSPRWRTWARRRISMRHVGEWTVTAYDATGEVLGSTGFLVESPVAVLAHEDEPGC
jgi:hypothetical protein